MKTAARRIGILGGTFDPIHWGHLDLADVAVNELKLTRLFVITSNVPPHRPQPLASSYHRFAMVSLADPRSPRLARRRSRAAARRAVVHLAHAGSVSRARLPVVGAVLRHRRRRVRRDRELARLPEDSGRGALRRRLAPGVVGEGAAAAAAAAGGSDGAAADRRGRADRSVDYSDRRADRRRVIHCDPRAARGRRRTSPGWCRRTCSNTLNTTDFTRR